MHIYIYIYIYIYITKGRSLRPLLCTAHAEAMLANGRVAIPFEKETDPSCQDFLSAQGFALALNLALITVPGGGGLGAPVCSTWVAINLGTSGRSKFRPLGNWWYPSVADANVRPNLICIPEEALK